MSSQARVLNAKTLGQSASDLHADASAKLQYNLELIVTLDNVLRGSANALRGLPLRQHEERQAAIREFPDLEKLFGSQSFCECEHCRSVYSPAAYLVDLLHVFLDNTTKQNPTGPITKLLKRRPDLVKIKLSCENTNTTLPYVDLVNEVLESYIKAHLVNGKWSDAPQSGETITAYDTGSALADELRAVPQNVDAVVYSYLANEKEAVYPMTLPYDRPLEVVRTYLAHLGTSRAELMEAFQSPMLATDPTKVLPQDHDIAIERLGLSPGLANIIAGTDAKPTREYYGYQTDADLKQLNEVPKFLQRTGLDLNDVLELLKTSFINPHINESENESSAIRIEYASWPQDACDVRLMKFVNLQPVSGTQSENVERIHRFVRLWRVLGWTMADLDMALSTLGGELNEETLEKLAALKQLALELDRPVADLLPLWGKISQWGDTSPYSEIFLSPAIISDSAERDVFKTFKESDGTTAQLDKHLPAVAAALAITMDDVTRIRLYLGQTLSGDLSLESLSIFCRYAVLAKALTVRVRELITLLSMASADADPFKSTDPRPALKFVQIAQTVLASGFSIPLLNYLFRGEEEPTRHPAPTRELIENTFKNLQKGLAAIHQGTIVPEQPTAADLHAAFELAKNFLGQSDAATGKLIPLSSDEALAILDPRISEFNGQPIKLSDRTTFVSKHFTPFLSKANQDILFNTSFTTDLTEARFLKNVSAILADLLPWLRVKEQELLTTQAMASAIGADETVTEALLKEKVDGNIFLLHSTQNDSSADQRSALSDFLSLIDEVGNAVDFEVDSTSTAPVATFVRMFKAAAFINAFGMTEPELKLFAGSLTPAKIQNVEKARLNFNLFPLGKVTATDIPPQQHFALWQQLTTYYQLRAALPKSEKTLPDFFVVLPDSTVTLEVKIQALGELAGWEEEAVEALRTGFQIKVTDLNDLDRLSDFHKAVNLTKRLGAKLKRKKEGEVELPNAFDWAATAPKAAQAEAIVQLVKARYERKQWLEVARGLNDPLREQQRDALVQLLVPRIPNLSDSTIVTANELLEYFLIDVEMTSCMLTSRIKQAISSVQLFIQRCLLNLESEVSPAEIDTDWWEWMKNYRIWEANRKVFLYPENWIEPELRDDKTPFFKDLETELLQNELTDDTVEMALVNYLYKLDEVARLDIRGFCKEEKEENGEVKEIYHVFGRTWNPPYIYYYRRGTFPKDGPTADEWTPWERVDLDIQGDHLIPVIYNRRLFVFWPTFKEVADRSVQVKEQKPPSQWEIKINWAELKNGRLGPKGASQEPLVHSIDSFLQTTLLQSFGEEVIAEDALYHRARINVDGENLSLQIVYAEFWKKSNDGSSEWGHTQSKSDGLQGLTPVGEFKLNDCNGHLERMQDPGSYLKFYATPNSYVRAQALWCFDDRLRFPAMPQALVLGQIQLSKGKPLLTTSATLDEQSSKHWFPFYFNHGPNVYFARPVTVWLPPGNVGEKTDVTITQYSQQVSFIPVKEKVVSEIDELAGMRQKIGGEGG